MKAMLYAAAVVLAIFSAGCTTSGPDRNAVQSNANLPAETVKEQTAAVQEESPSSEPASENGAPSDFSLSVNNAVLSLHVWDNEIDLEQTLGAPITQNVEQLENADTHTGSFIKKLEYDGLHMELFSPKQNGKTFWIMSMLLSKEGYKTAKGIEVGSTLEEVKTAYPGIEMAPDGRTDPDNAAYAISNEAQTDHLQFEVKEGLVSEIKIFSQLP
ncbi:hypothetical protein ACFSL6_25415 [Paenibacillus thailandensis]|uniref:DUF4309 domain-containing protein n=1 Tax=Paenibacillus thailandensis TaxID=393250 RepID=A0ABW5QWF6_9BACL